eukprot:PhF_6_TR25872/c0_g1_i2/m.36575
MFCWGALRMGTTFQCMASIQVQLTTTRLTIKLTTKLCITKVRRRMHPKASIGKPTFKIQSIYCMTMKGRECVCWMRTRGMKYRKKLTCPTCLPKILSESLI